MRVCLDTFRRSAGCRRRASVMPWLLCRCSRRDDRSRCAGDAGPRGGRRAGLVVGARPPPGCWHQPGLEQFQSVNSCTICCRVRSTTGPGAGTPCWPKKASRGLKSAVKWEMTRKLPAGTAPMSRAMICPGSSRSAMKCNTPTSSTAASPAEVQCAGRPGHDQVRFDVAAAARCRGGQPRDGVRHHHRIAVRIYHHAARRGPLDDLVNVPVGGIAGACGGSRTTRHAWCVNVCRILALPRFRYASRVVSR